MSSLTKFEILLICGLILSVSETFSLVTPVEVEPWIAVTVGTGMFSEISIVASWLSSVRICGVASTLAALLSCTALIEAREVRDRLGLAVGQRDRLSALAAREAHDEQAGER